MKPLPTSWAKVLEDELQKPYFEELCKFLEEERGRGPVYPCNNDLFCAFELTPFEAVKVLILGQDPYPGENQAHGLAFSVRPGISVPRSLVNIFKELKSDVGCEAPDHGCLEHWGRQGVLLLNTVLTVRAGEANSHKNRGWEQFTDAVIRKLNERNDPVVFVLWGAEAQKKAALINAEKHRIIKSAHPSPLSARTGFFGSRPFSQINAALGEWGKTEIHWTIP